VAMNVLIDTFDGGVEQHTLLAVPRSVEVERNDHRTADTARIELDWRDLPMDPRAIVSIAVDVWLGDAGDPDAEIDIGAEETLVFAGYVDEPSASWSEQGETISLECRDYTSLLLDTTWTGGSLRVDRPFYEVVDEVFGQIAGAAGIGQEYSPGIAELVISTRIGRRLYVPRPGDDAWTVLVELCGILGVVPVIDRRHVAFRVPNEVSQRTVSLTYGVDVSRLEFRRKLKDRRAGQVEVRCWDPEARTTRTLRHPATAVVSTRKVSAEGKITETYEPITPWFVQGTYTEAQLEGIARLVYSELAQEQLEGEVETHEMADRDGVDIAQAANGDTLSIRLDRQDLTSLDGMSDEEAIRWLTTGVSALPVEVAAALVAAHRRAEDLATSFYIRRAHHTWSRESGYGVTLSFTTYLGS
jgi:hypothetical protein